MYSLLLPPDCFAPLAAAQERPLDRLRRTAASLPPHAVRGPVTGVLRVRAMELRRAQAADPASRWSLV